jgi:predicted lipoprotein with Yx(FWY)xxD motif
MCFLKSFNEKFIFKACVLVKMLFLESVKSTPSITQTTNQMKKIYAFLIAGIFAFGAKAQTSVTFSVDMSNQTVSANGVHIAGNFNDNNGDGTPENAAYNNWDPAAIALMDMGNGIWSVELSLVPGTYEFKFINDNAWGADEAAPTACSVSDSNSNRQIMVGEAAQTFGPVCFAECAACGTSVVRFRVDMSLVDADEDGTPGEAGEDIWPAGVSVAGNFQNPDADGDGSGDWTPGLVWLTDEDGDMIYEGEYNVGAMASITYKFINGDSWLLPNENVSGDCSDGSGNRLNAISGSVVLPAVCWSACGSCVAPTPVTFSVDMSLQTLVGNGVHLAGSFGSSGYDQWNPGGIEMLDGDGDGIYSVTLNLQQGDYNFKVVNGNGWDAPNVNENIPGECAIGGNNRGLTVGTDPIELAFCYGQCTAACISDPDPATVTFRVDMSNEVVAAEGVYMISGSTNPAWQAGATQMTDGDGDGVYECSVLISGPASVLYKFVNGAVNNPVNEEGVATATSTGIEACGLPNGLGGFNRALNRSGVDETLEAICYNSCAACIVNVEEEEAVSNLSIFPVPANDVLNIRFNNQNSQSVVINLVNNVGQIVRNVNLGTVTGVSNVEMNVNNLSSGVYVVQISNGNSSVVRQIVVQ